MGVKGFSKVFAAQREIKERELAGANIVIDGNIAVHRGAAGKFILTGPDGQSTKHINTVLLGVILKLAGAGANQYWIFDNDTPNHAPFKAAEVQRRRDIRQRAAERLETIIADATFDDDEVAKLQRQAAPLEGHEFADVKLMLDLLDIPWALAPHGLEAEQVCAAATNDASIFGVAMDYVLTEDMDALVFGASRILTRRTINSRKVMYLYELDTLLHDNEISLDDLKKIAILLGTDFAPKTRGIGPGSVLRRFRSVLLTDEQEAAMRGTFCASTAGITLHIMNADAAPFSDAEKYTALLDWIEVERGYNRERIAKQFAKYGLFSGASA